VITNQASTSNGAQLDTTLTVTATCPAGTVLLGGGARVANSDATHPARVGIISSEPTGASSWQAIGVVTTGLGQSNAMTVTAFAVCTT
jgi:hypothetical protein